MHFSLITLWLRGCIIDAGTSRGGAMGVKTRPMIEDLYKIAGKAELVNGEIVEMPPVGEDPGRASLYVAKACSITKNARTVGGCLGMVWDFACPCLG
jgi:hypothetical protein